jgi:hypothetical protein
LTDGVIESLRLRGPGAARLSRVAATTLPAALDRALAGVAPVHIESLSVLLDLDPNDYDDVTLGALWADAIRAEVLRQVPLRESEEAGPDVAAASVRASARGSLTMADAVAAARAWLAEVGNTVVPVDALALADLVSQSPLAAHDKELGSLIVYLAAALSPRHHRPVATPAWEQRSAGRPSGGHREASDDTSHASHTARQAAPAPSDRPAEGEPRALASESVEPTASDVRAAASRVAALAALVEPESPSLDLEHVTSAAGLPLLYPWLADLCRRAVDLHPGLDEPAVRAHALAALVDPGDLGLVDDPLVRFLSGVSEPLSARAPLPHHREVSDEAERVLASFASLLPGFGQSSPAFVRNEWIRRAGLLDSEREPAQLTAATHPLDVMLIRLPYPLALFKLPWSPALMVRFRP